MLETGAGVSNVKAGDRVMSMMGWGGFQEEVMAEAETCMLLPPGMGYEIGASFSLTYGTSYHALVDRARLKAGETLLVLGAAGGVGTAAVEIGKALGGRIIAAGGSDEKLAKLAELYDVDETINYGSKGELLKEQVNALTDGNGADVIFDPIGGEAFQQCLRCISWGGRILVIGFAADGENLPQARTNLLLLKGSSLVGVFWGRFTARNPGEERRELPRAV